MFVTYFTLICAIVAAAGVVGLYIAMDDLRGQLSLVSVQLDDLTRLVRAIDEEVVIRADIVKLNQALKEHS